ncbi:MAG: outer membrane protein assembly factor BamE [Proteobacteria bacterium]|nr:outer membrane protein assembly factor BamE [Pseudomonadota bacterium]
MNTISVGMSKQEVVKIMGTPDTSKAASGVEYLIYKLQDTLGTCVGISLLTFGIGVVSPECKGALYFVQLRNGAVSAYGKQGDFDSTKDPTLRILTQ